MAETHLTATRFDSFDLDPRILQGLRDAAFDYCTPIQAETLPIALTGQDVAGQAQTGTGKTAAFLLAILQRLLAAPAQPPRDHGDRHGHAEPRSRPRALIVAPTRELAVQIHKDTLVLARHTGFRIGLVFGGTGYQQQRDDLAAGIDILIGTPGRLIDYFKQHVFSLKAVEAVVLDEADRMFDLGFIKDIRFLFKRMPPPEERLGMLFSATLSYRVLELAYEHMNHPRMVKIESDKVTAERVRQVCYMTANSEKIPLLVGLVRTWTDPRVMVFVNTKREADRVWGYLQGNGINTAVLSGDVPQKKRLSLLKRFTDGDLPVLVGTDVAARGLHIPDVTHVVNYDLPEDAEDYVHRIGRTARAGAAGDAISLVCETYAFCLPDIERFIGAKVPVRPVAPELLAQVDPRSRLRPDREDREYRREGRDGHGRRGSRDDQVRAPARGERRRGDRPTAERPQAEAPSSQVPIADRPESERPPSQAAQGEASARRTRSRRRSGAVAAVGAQAAAQVQGENEPRSEGTAEQAALTSPPPRRRRARAPSAAVPRSVSVDEAATAPAPAPAPTAEGQERDDGADPVKRRRRRRRRKPVTGESGPESARVEVAELEEL
jgi:ATP-dependent RNA helicase RhlB